MATIRRPVPASNSAWDCVVHAADSVCQTASAYLNGRFVFTFTNTAKRTVKLHLAEDVDASERGKGKGSEGRADYFLTVPPGAEGVEVPMASSRLRVTAGFFHPEMGTYEVFWESRPFAYEPGCTIAIAARHSVDVNRFHVDVWPGAPLASSPEVAKALPAAASGTLRQAGLGSLRLFALPAPPQANGLAKADLQIFSLKGKDWVSGNVSKELPDGSIEIGNGSKVWVVNPREQASLVRFPAFADGSGSTIGSKASIRVMDSE
eukprot:CAMPEP_0183490226 /NCGR_PEP_ID=MMETSP0370-20130417/181839_1 /TAXON_ID=268820 /ORGANISM="Peridinium aciculiferum, Strain PAER-2" /LENGTH=262 /DNA_ID=CAMNT_0025683563 /DNA_START=72 /DNA_END=860 /DNA_ORIENTATION=-